MRIVLTDGTELSCKSFKAIDAGVLLTSDKKRKKVVGFVPHHQLRYVVSDDVQVRDSAVATADEDDSAASPDVEGGTSVAEVSDLQRLGGLGPTYADRLQAAGYATLADLATADPTDVAEVASVAPGRGRRWVDAAVRVTTGSGAEDDIEDAAPNDDSDAETDDVAGTDEPSADVEDEENEDR